MQLKELSLFVPKIEPGTILKALEAAIPASAIEQALKDTNAGEERKRALPSHLVVCAKSWNELVVKNLNERSPEKFS